MNILAPQTFYPVGWFDADQLYAKETDDHWDAFFAGSLTVHFFQSSRSYESKILKPRHYGSHRPALLYLALRHCPVSYDSVSLF